MTCSNHGSESAPNTVPVSKPDRCERCGAPNAEREPVIKRGAVVVAFDPLLISWHGHPVPLSRIEAEVYAHISRRGRVSLDELSRFMEGIGARASTRSLVLGHIRGKFVKIGACAPFEAAGHGCIRLVVDPDERGSRSPVIGLELPRYVTVQRARKDVVPAWRSGVR